MLGKSVFKPPAGGPVVVIKVGTSSLLSSDGSSVSLSTMSRVVETAADLRRQGFSVVLVSSGAVGMGCVRLGVKRRPKRIHELQALAAVGQIRLMQLYDSLFSVSWYKFAPCRGRKGVK